MDLRELIKQELNQSADDSDVVAARMIAAASRSDRTAWLQTLLSDKVDNVRRNGYRTVERAAFAAIYAATHEPVRAAYDSCEERAKLVTLFRNTFALGDGRDVSWGRATVEEHRIRISLLQKKADGIIKTVEQHEIAITLIEGAGVECLDQVPDAAVHFAA